MDVHSKGNLELIFLRGLQKADSPLYESGGCLKLPGGGARGSREQSRSQRRGAGGCQPKVNGLRTWTRDLFARSVQVHSVFLDLQRSRCHGEAHVSVCAQGPV